MKEPREQPETPAAGAVLDEVRDRKILEALGLLTKQGSLAADARRKFQQIRHALSLLVPLLPEDASRELVLVDANCGRSWMGLLLLHAVERRGRRARLLGFDRDAVAIGRCREFARRAGLKGAEFLTSPTAEMALPQQADLVISLHGCDTATDEAMQAAVQAEARVMALVPCCHREMKPLLGPGHALMSAGILREDYAAVLTDALRAEWLRSRGWQTEVIEFVPLEHTARNRLIRARWTGKKDVVAAERIAAVLKGLEHAPVFLATAE